MTTTEAAAILECSPEHVTRLCRNGEIRAFRVASAGSRKPRWRITSDDLAAYRLGTVNRPDAAPEMAPTQAYTARSSDGFVPTFPELWP